jgi:hypothetical protein
MKTCCDHEGCLPGLGCSKGNRPKVIRRTSLPTATGCGFLQPSKVCLLHHFQISTETSMGFVPQQGNQSRHSGYACRRNLEKRIGKGGTANRTLRGKLGMASEGDCEENIWKMSCQHRGFAAAESDLRRRCQRTVAYVNWYRCETLGQGVRVSASSDSSRPQMCWDRALVRIR